MLIRMSQIPEHLRQYFEPADYSLDIAERIAAADPVAYVAKASRRERNAGCEGLAEQAYPVSVIQTPGVGLDGETLNGKQAARARNPHPTVKPIALARWLATLLLPPDAYAPRRILIPFSGSGSECIGAMLAGWEDVQGIEGEAEYVEIARARLAWWEANRDKAPKVRAMGQSPRAAERASDPTGATRHDRMHGGNYANGADRTNGTHARPTAPPMLPGMEGAAMTASLSRRVLTIIYTHDPASAVAVAFALVLIPVRMWTMYTATQAGMYSAFPLWLQAWITATLIGQLAAELVGHIGMRRQLSAYVIVASVLATFALAFGDHAQGGWVLWFWFTMVQCWVFYRLSIVSHRMDYYAARG